VAVTRPVIVTRPGPAGSRLQHRLEQAGWSAVWCPAFQLGPAPDSELARSTLARLADFDLAVFVSPAAVAAVAGLLETPWPVTTTIGAVGAATEAAVRQRLRLPTEVRVVAPAVEDAAGSEAFWSEWLRSGAVARRVLILRAQHGREWLGEQFVAAGAEVRVLAVYTRAEVTLDATARESLQQWVAAGAPAISIFSSSEAVNALDRQLRVLVGAAAWLRNGVAVATHERISSQLLAAGYTRVELSAPDDDSLMARLELF
jgi:uroporphyrinogen-III synthase